MDKGIVKAHEIFSPNHWWFTGRMAIVSALLRAEWGKRRFSQIIDIGGGGGAMVPLLREFGQQITLLEPDPALCLTMQKRFSSDSSVNVLAGQIESVVERGHYDVVAMFDVLEHIADDERALSSAWFMLKKGGYLVLTVPAYKFLWSKHDEMNGHKRRYTKGDLLSKITRSGFTVEQSTYFNFLLFPVVLLVRFASKFLPQRETDFALGSGPLNKFLRHIFSAERFILLFTTIPFGVSIYALAVKNHD